MQILLKGYIELYQFYLAKKLIDFIVVIQKDLKDGEGIYYNTYIKPLEEMHFDLTEFYKYVVEFEVKIIK